MTPFIILCLIVTFTAVSTAKDVPCTTPDGREGGCVALEMCSHLYAAKKLYQTLPTVQENYIRNATCKLADPRSQPGVCCALEKIFELPQKCGIESSNRIAHGNKTAVFEFPWMALLMYRDQEDNELHGDCGGSLISDQYVITAAHCLEQNLTRSGSLRKLELVRLGEHTISTNPDCINYTDSGGYFEQDCAGPTEDTRFESYTVHPGFRKSFSGDDIGLIRLAEKVVFKFHIKPICLPISVELKDILLPQYIVTGWGLTESYEKPDILMKALIPRVTPDRCQEQFNPYKRKYNITINERQICAGSTADLVDTCLGDSGGPLMWLTNHTTGPPQYVLYGVVSYGVSTCGSDFPGVYARVGAYLEWILDTMRA